MQTMTDKRFSISLTATIAELYEAQKHYFAAFVVYWFLFQKEKREEYRDKLTEIRDKIFETGDLRYDPTIKEIFSPEELRRFGILPKHDYEEFETAINDLQRDEKEGINSIDTGDDEDFQTVGKGIGLEWQHMIDDEQSKSKARQSKAPKITIDLERWEQIRASELIDFLTEFKAQDKNLNEVKLSVLIENFLRNYDRENDLNDES